MNTKTGAIATFETRADALKAGYDLALTEKQVKALMPLPRVERLKQVDKLLTSRRWKSRKRR